MLVVAVVSLSRCQGRWLDVLPAPTPRTPHSPSLNPLQGVTPTPPRETQSYTFQQTMLRIKDPMASLDFYTRVLGMTLLSKLSFPERSFSLYFLGYAPAAARPADEADRVGGRKGRV